MMKYTNTLFAHTLHNQHATPAPLLDGEKDCNLSVYEEKEHFERFLFPKELQMPTTCSDRFTDNYFNFSDRQKERVSDLSKTRNRTPL